MNSMQIRRSFINSVLFRSFLGALAASFGLCACTSPNLYRYAHLPPPPLHLGYVYPTRNYIYKMGEEPVEFGSPLATSDRVFVESATVGIQAFTRHSFRPLWSLKIKNGASSRMLYLNNRLYFGADDGRVYAVNADFGNVIWKYDIKAPVYARPTIADGLIYINASDDVLYCLNAKTGKWTWHYKRGGNYLTTIHGNSTPVVDNGLVFAGFSDGYIVALNAKDGNLVWEQKIHQGAKFTDVDATPVLDGNTIYIPSYDGSLYALRKKDGSILWHIDVGGSKAVILDHTMLYLGSSDGHVYGIRKDSGRIMWKFTLDAGTPTHLVEHNTYLAFGASERYFYVIHKGDGSLVYRFNVSFRSGFVAAPYEKGNDLYVYSDFGNLYVFHWKNRKEERRLL